MRICLESTYLPEDTVLAKYTKNAIFVKIMIERCG